MSDKLSPATHNAPAATVADHQQPVLRRIGLRLGAGERKQLLMAGDLLLINGALLAAVSLWGDFTPSIPALIANAKWFITLSFVWLVFAALLDVYDLARAASVSSIIASISITGMLTVLTYVFIPVLTPALAARSYIFGFAIIGGITIPAWRAFYARGLSQPAFQRHVFVVGTGETARKFARELNENYRAGDANPFRGTGYQVVGMLSEKPDWSNEGLGELQILGDARQLMSLARAYDIDEIIVALDDQQAATPAVYEALLDCRELGWRVSSLAEIYERLSARLPVEYAVRDVQLLLGRGENSADRLYLASKRVMDIVLSVAGLLPLVLVVPWVALGNALFSPGPLFYRQERVGKGGKTFAVIKFRSMVVNAEQGTGAVWSLRGDRRITPVGQFLRKSRLDELPQLLNVLKGDMSWVGPRPERPHFVGQLAHRMPLYRLRNAAQPGITGWAQIRHCYGDSLEDSRIKLEYDLYYVKHASLYLDLMILLQTVTAVIQMKGR